MNLMDWIPKAYAATQAATSATQGAGSKIESGILGYALNHVGYWIAGVAIVVMAAILAKSAGVGARNAMMRAKGEEVQENALVLVERMTKLGILLIGATIALAINGLNFTAVVGAVSLGIGFALKQVIENFISSVVMLSQNRIRIGDLVEVNGFKGRVLGIDMRTTALQQLDGPIVTIPNEVMLGSKWVSYSANPFRRFELIIGVNYDTDVTAAINLIRSVIAKDADIADKPEPSVLIDDYGDDSLTVKVWCWVPIKKPFKMVRSNLAYRIKRAFDAAGIKMQYPVRTLKIDEDDAALLKTIDSIKKGIVPEQAESKISNERIAELALATEKMGKIPTNVFDQPKPVPVPVAESPAAQSKTA